MNNNQLKPHQLIKIHGDSMRPFINPGDELDIVFFDKPKPIQELKEGQIVLINDRSEWIAHRVLNCRGRFVTKGDWSNTFDSSEVYAWGEVVASANKKKLGGVWVAQISKLDFYFQSRLVSKIKKIILTFAYFRN